MPRRRRLQRADPVAAVVFDLDGTLIDSAPDIQATANAVLAREGRKPLSHEEVRRFIGSGAPAFVRQMRAARDLADSAHDRLLAAFLEGYETAVDLTRLYPGVWEALETLHEAGHRLGVCTNKPEAPTHAILRHLGLGRWFEVVVGGDTLPVRKPDPAPLRHAFTPLGTGPQVYVGDSEVDAETAVRAAVPFALFTEGYRKGPVSAIPHAAGFAEFKALPGIVADLTSGRAQP